MKNKTDTLVGILVMAFSLFGYWGTTFTSNVAGTTDPIGPVAFTHMALVLLFICGVIQTITGLRARVAPNYWSDAAVQRRIWTFVALICGYVTLAMWVGDILQWLDLEDTPSGWGFTIVSFIYLSVTLFACGRRNPLEILGVAFLMPATVCYIFVEFFQLVLP